MLLSPYATLGDRLRIGVLIGWCALVLAFLVLPIFVPVPLSVNSEAFFTFPLAGFSWRWYEEVLGSDQWREAIWHSIVIAIGATVLRGSARRGAEGALLLDLDGMRSRCLVARDGEALTLRQDGETYRLRLPDPIAGAEDADDAGDRLLAPIPGQVTQVLVAPGESVTRGQVLVVLEAMKTVFRLTAPADATVEAVACAAGGMVQEGQVLVSFATAEG